MITTHGLSKRFGSVLAVDSIDLDVKDGERYGFLGPNGSGKTTTVRMLLGLIYATRGEIELLGRPVPKDVGRALREVGALVESPAAYPHLSARANLSLLDASGPRGHRMPGRRRAARIAEVLELVGLGQVGRRPVKAYSLGMRQRLGLASALLNQPRLLILDEPTNGLDPQGIQEIRELLLRLNRDGTTIFLSSHLLAEVEQVCTRVGVMDRGRLVAQESMDDVRAVTGRSLVRVDDVPAAAGLLGGRVVGRTGDRLVVEGMSVAELTRQLVEARIDVLEAMPERGSLEELVLRLTGPGSDRVDGHAGGPQGDPQGGPS